MTADSSNSQSQSSRGARISTDASSRTNNNNNNKYPNKNNRRKYSRKLPLSPTERSALTKRRKRQSLYEEMRLKSLNITNEPPSIWSFESLFPRPVWDEESILNDLFGNKLREEEVVNVRQSRRREEEEQQQQQQRVVDDDVGVDTGVTGVEKEERAVADSDFKFDNKSNKFNSTNSFTTSNNNTEYKEKVDEALTRMVRDRQSGLTRNPDGSVQFKDNNSHNRAIPLNTDRLNYFAKKDLSHGKVEEAQSYYLRAVRSDPADGRAYLGLSRIAQRRGDYEYARSLLKRGIQKSSWGYVDVRGPYQDKLKDNGSNNNNGGGGGSNNSINNKNNRDKKKQWKAGPIIGTIRDNGPNPFLLQALGALEQKTGHIGTAEDLYLQALRSRPSHAAAWVSLAQLRTKQLRQGAHAGRVCYQSAEHELKRIGGKPNAFVYTAWARNEYVKGDETTVRRARELYQRALDADPHCSTAYLQLGAMESDCGNFDRARECFESVLKFDRKNSRVLQAYAIMESRRPREEVDSRKVLDLFERALKANPRDAGVYQAYALYVKELGDVDAARDLLRRGTRVDKRHAPAWQAWGVLETDYSTAKIARDVFQQGIWACAQPGGGQSGGRRCARLWQAWGCLEAREGEHAAARRCFSRALDADPRNVAAVTAWTTMEFDLGNYADARSIFQRESISFLLRPALYTSNKSNSILPYTCRNIEIVSYSK